MNKRQGLLNIQNVKGIRGDFVWDDIRFPATRIRQGASAKPDFDTTDLGLLFPQNDPAEIAYIIAQMPHDYKLGTNLKPHIHYFQDEAQEPVFKIDYRIYKNGVAPGGFSTITASTFVFTYTSGTLAQIVVFPEIDMSAIDTVSAVIDVKLYRDDNVVTGDVLLKELDFHYKRDSLGSQFEYIKGF